MLRLLVARQAPRLCYAQEGRRRMPFEPGGSFQSVKYMTR